MSRKIMSAVAVLAALTATPVLAQSKAPPKASKADVQKLVDSIKADKTKMAAYCVVSKLQDQIGAIAEKNQKDPKLKDLGKQVVESGKKIGPDYEKIMSLDMDDATGALLDDLAKSCK